MYVASAMALASSVSGAVSRRVSCFRVKAAQVYGTEKGRREDAVVEGDGFRG